MRSAPEHERDGQQGNTAKDRHNSAPPTRPPRYRDHVDVNQDIRWRPATQALSRTPVLRRSIGIPDATMEHSLNCVRSSLVRFAVVSRYPRMWERFHETGRPCCAFITPGYPNISFHRCSRARRRASGTPGRQWGTGGGAGAPRRRPRARFHGLGANALPAINQGPLRIHTTTFPNRACLLLGRAPVLLANPPRRPGRAGESRGAFGARSR
jgi:hypothetical protein